MDNIFSDINFIAFSSVYVVTHGFYWVFSHYMLRPHKKQEIDIQIKVSYN